MSAHIPSASQSPASDQKASPSAFTKASALLAKQNWEMMVLAVYCVLLIVVTVFHEPWYDEAQAWMIARTASLNDILFRIPHYEGHPPLWHLLLLPFARLGLPFEPCIKAISIGLGVFSMWLLLFRSPLPRALRLTLPFTYFIFYQYVIISRPYSLLMLGFFLAALAYPERDRHPYRFAGALLLLCCSSSYGIVLAGGIAAAWVLELWNREPLSRFYKKIRRSRQLWALLLLLAAALILIALIFPAPDANGINLEDGSNGFLSRLVYTFFVAPLDAMFFQSMGYGALIWQKIAPLPFWSGLLIGILVFAMFLWLSFRCQKTALFLIPYSLYAVFCAKVYFWTHHTGILLLFLIFLLWCFAHESGGLGRLLPAGNMICFAFYSLAIFSVSISILWTASACYSDVQYNYGHGREFAAFIKDNHLEDYSMMVSWEHVEDEETSRVTILDLTNCTEAIGILPYFSHNIFNNFREGTDTGTYSFNRLPDDTRNEQVIAQCLSMGMPDILVGTCHFEDIFPRSAYFGVGYIPVAYFTDNYIWKNKLYETGYHVYMRQELAEALGLKNIYLED